MPVAETFNYTSVLPGPSTRQHLDEFTKATAEYFGTPEGSADAAFETKEWQDAISGSMTIQTAITAALMFLSMATGEEKIKQALSASIGNAFLDGFRYANHIRDEHEG